MRKRTNTNKRLIYYLFLTELAQKAKGHKPYNQEWERYKMTNDQTQFKYLRAAVNKEHLETFENQLKSVDACKTQEELMHVLRYARRVPYVGTLSQQKNKAILHFKRRCEQRRRHDLKLIEDAETAPNLPNPLIITIEWTRSRMWGMNPTASTNYGFDGSSIGGCGYCKHSTATAQALNSCLPIMKALYAAKDAALMLQSNKPLIVDKDLYAHGLKAGQVIKVQNDINRVYLGYGSGYGIIPRFEGGVGVECHRRICEKLGFKWETVTDTKHVNVYRIA
jgi:hypothetical protein